MLVGGQSEPKIRKFEIMDTSDRSKFEIDAKKKYGIFEIFKFPTKNNILFSTYRIMVRVTRSPPELIKKRRSTEEQRRWS